jgi:hypothetical protein
MSWINYNGEKYMMKQWRIQCLKCDTVLQSWDCYCKCGLVIIKNGQRTWPYFPVRDISVWTNSNGYILPQSVLDHYFLSRETDKTSTNTETGTSTS